MRPGLAVNRGRGRLRNGLTCRAIDSKSDRMARISFSPAVARLTSRASVRMSVTISASERGLIARKATGSFRMLATVSGANGTEPIRTVGLSRITSRTSIFQQSPTCGRAPPAPLPCTICSRHKLSASAERQQNRSHIRCQRNNAQHRSCFFPLPCASMSLWLTFQWFAYIGDVHRIPNIRFQLAAQIRFADLCLPFLDGLPTNGVTNLRANSRVLEIGGSRLAFLSVRVGRWRTSSSAAALTIASVTLLAFDATIPSASPGKMYELLVCAM